MSKRLTRGMLTPRKGKALLESKAESWWYIEPNGISVYAQTHDRALTGVFLSRRQLEAALRVMRQAEKAWTIQ